MPQKHITEERDDLHMVLLSAIRKVRSSEVYFMLIVHISLTHLTLKHDLQLNHTFSHVYVASCLLSTA